MQITSDAIRGWLKIEGSLDISNADDLRRALSESLDREQDLTVDISGVESCDTAALQVFFSAARTSLAAEKRFILAEPLPESVVNTGASLGLSLESLTGSRYSGAV